MSASKPIRRKRLRLVAGGLLLLAVMAVGAGVCLKVMGVNVWRLGAARQSQPRGSDRDGRWATPIDRPGLPNLHKLSDELYRGAQPTAQGMAELKAMGVRTVANLRSFHSDRDEIGETGLAYEHITMKPWHAEEKEVVRFLQIVADPGRAPVFVHCKRGADRTGTMCAVYRVVVQGWTKEQAIQEMTQGGYGYWDGWESLVEFLETLDVDDIRRRVQGTD